MKKLGHITRVVKKLFEKSVVGYVEWIGTESISGWVIDKKASPLHLKCSINGKDQPFSIRWFGRSDIGASFGWQHEKSGFTLEFGAEGIAELNAALLNNLPVKVFANNLLLAEVAERSQMSAVPLQTEKLDISYQGAKFTTQIEYWGHFTLHGTVIDNVSEDVIIELYCNNQLLECVTLWKDFHDKSDNVQQQFEIEIPGYIWELAAENKNCQLEIHLNKENITPSGLELSHAKALAWINDIAKMADGNEKRYGQEKQYRGLLALEHIRYGGFLPELPAKNLASIRQFAEKMLLVDFVFKDKNLSSAVETVSEDPIIVAIWKALSTLNRRIKDKQIPVFEQVKAVIEELQLNDSAKTRFLFSVTPLLCNTGEFLQLREFPEFSALAQLAKSEDLWEMSLALPALISEKQLNKATDLANKITEEIVALTQNTSKNVSKEGSWLGTECIYAALVLAKQIELEGKAELAGVEEFRSAIILLLDAFEGEWFSRLHDQKLIDSMVLMLFDLERYNDSHRKATLLAAQRIYGLNPSFWQAVLQKNILQFRTELTPGYMCFKKIHQGLTGRKNSVTNLLESVAEPLAYFNTINNRETIIFLREILLNHLNELNESLPARGKALLTKLLDNKSESLRIAAYPLVDNNILLKQFPETSPEILRETLRSLSETNKSKALSTQEQASAALDSLLNAHSQNDKEAIKRALYALEQQAVLLNEWESGFLALDLLTSAYIISDLQGLNTSALLSQMLSILEKVIKETTADWFLSAPVLSGLIRLNQFQSTDNLALQNFITECRTVVTWKFGQKFDDLFEPVTELKLKLFDAGWPQDTLVVIYSCRKYLDTRVNAIRQTWVQDLKARNIPYLVIVGDGDDSITDDVLALNVSDRYEDLPKKTLKLFDWLYRHTNAQYVLKIDDDCYLDVERFFNTLSYRKHFYYGRTIKRGVGSMDRTWHQSKSYTEHSKKSIDKSPEPSTYADGGGGYTLSRLAILKLLEAEKTIPGERLIACSFMEDKLTGDLLALSAIEPSNEDYDSYQRRRTFAEAIPVAIRENIFFPGKATPTKVVHLDTELDLVSTQTRTVSEELWPKKIWPTCFTPKIQHNNNQLELLTGISQTNALLEESLCVVGVMRNEMIMLPHFLTHYRNLGIKCFILADNCSDDGTREYLYQQPDVVLYSTDTLYKHSHYGVTWQQAVLGNHCLGKWVLLADADELLVFEDSENRTLTDLIEEIEDEDANAAATFMIDMYPKDDLAEADFSKDNPFSCANWFDRFPLIKWQLSSGMYSNSTTYLSALRHRLTEQPQPNAFTCQKYGLIRYQPWIRYSEGLHDASNIKVFSKPTWFAHFKYHAGFKEKVEIEIRRGQHFNNAAEYRRYAALLSEGRGGFAQEGISVKYSSSTDFANTMTSKNEHE